MLHLDILRKPNSYNIRKKNTSVLSDYVWCIWAVLIEDYNYIEMI